MQLKLKSKSKNETMEIAEILANYLVIHDVILLNGELGAGKTTFTQGLARGMGVTETIKSPTFNIVKNYTSGRLALTHIDAYRLEGSKGDIGLDEYTEGDGVSVIEWPQYLSGLIRHNSIEITLQPLTKNSRMITIVIDDVRAVTLEKEVSLWLIS